jgi:23S rRNA pseudouridine1911/1915/1917 synthase
VNNSDRIISIDPESENVDDSVDIGAEFELRQLAISAKFHSERLDRALADLIPEFSRSYIQQLIDLSGVTVNGVTIGKCSTRVKAGDVACVELRPTPQSQAFKPEVMLLDVVYEDEHLMVINKPSGLVVHPAPGNWSGTLLNGLLAHDKKAMLLPRAGIVHRLDKDTSGLMVVARTRSTMDALVQLIAARDVTRQYLALCDGAWTGDQHREVDAPVGRDPRNRLRMAVVDLEKHAGKQAKTSIELLDTTEGGSVVRCTLHTGRTHQIRVHMAHLGCPLVADETYGGVKKAGMARQALHAFRLAFTHPMTGKSMRFESDPPLDFTQALSLLGLSYNKVQFRM